MWLKNIVEVDEELSDLLATLNVGDVISVDELAYIMRNQRRWSLETVNKLADRVGTRFADTGNGSVRVENAWDWAVIDG